MRRNLVGLAGLALYAVTMAFAWWVAMGTPGA